jgi:hypothetical protein
MKKILALPLLLLLPLAALAEAPKACPYKADDLVKAFGVKFDLGTEEQAAGGPGCKYKTMGGSLKAGTDFSVWVFQMEPGPSQDMILKLTLGPGARPVPVKGDADGAQESIGDGLVDVFYKRQGWAVVLRSAGSLGNGTAGQTKRIAQLLKLPRLH